MSHTLNKRKIAVLATDGFEQSELTEPVRALRNAGATVEIVSLLSGKIKGWDSGDWGKTVKVDRTLDEVSVADYDGLVIPGGQINPDLLRVDERAVAFVKAFYDANKPIGAICHAPWLLIEAKVVQGHVVTSYHSIRTDLKNAGAHWVDDKVVVDEGIITSRSPDDLPAFCAKLVEEMGEGLHPHRRSMQMPAQLDL